jgi:hypothetical protein
LQENFKLQNICQIFLIIFYAKIKSSLKNPMNKAKNGESSLKNPMKKIRIISASGLK